MNFVLLYKIASVKSLLTGIVAKKAISIVEEVFIIDAEIFY